MSVKVNFSNRRVKKHLSKIGFINKLIENQKIGDIEIELPCAWLNEKIQFKKIGANSTVAENFASVNEVKIGRYCSIAINVSCSLGKHPTNYLSSSRFFYDNTLFGWNSRVKLVNFRCDKGVEIGHDVWIGDGVKIMNGVKIGNGAIVGSGAIVTKDVPEFAIVGGNPARLIRYRFSGEIIQELKEIQWWNYDLAGKNIDFDQIELAVPQLKELIKNGELKILDPEILTGDGFLKLESCRKKISRWIKNIKKLGFL